MSAAFFVVALFTALAAHAGGPPSLSPADEKARIDQERRIGAQVKAWRAQGTKALPALVKVACGADKSKRDMIDAARNVVVDNGAAAVRAVYAYGGTCAAFDPAWETTVGIERADLLADTYCNMSSRYGDVLPANTRALEEWGMLIVDSEARHHELAVAALSEAVDRSRDACDPSIWTALLPKLKEAAAHLPLASWRDVAGTHRPSARTQRDRAVLAALGASGDATGTLASLYDTADLPTKILIVAALERGGAASAPAFDRAVDLLSRTRDDETRFVALRSLFAMDVVLAPDDAARVVDVLLEWLPRLRPPSPSVFGPRSHSQEPALVWPTLAAEYAVRVLSRALPRSTDNERIRNALVRALAAPLERNVREVAAKALLEAAKSTSRTTTATTTLSPADERCAKDTLSAPRQPMPAAPNSMGGFAPSWTPPASCARTR